MTEPGGIPERWPSRRQLKTRSPPHRMKSHVPLTLQSAEAVVHRAHGEIPARTSSLFSLRNQRAPSLASPEACLPSDSAGCCEISMTLRRGYFACTEPATLFLFHFSLCWLLCAKPWLTAICRKPSISAYACVQSSLSVQSIYQPYGSTKRLPPPVTHYGEWLRVPFCTALQLSVCVSPIRARFLPRPAASVLPLQPDDRWRISNSSV